MPQARPKAPRQAQRRKTVRAKFPATECRIWSPSGKGGQGHEATMLDLGAGGTLVAVDVQVPVGDDVRCEFKLPASGYHVLHGRVLRCGPNADGKRFDLALEFSTTQTSEKELMHWVLSWIGVQQRILMGVPTADK